MSNTKVAIQVNSIEVLEKILGENAEVSVELKNAVVQEFTKRHLKGVAKELIENGKEELVATIIRDLTSEEFQYNTNSSYNRIRISENRVKAIREFVKNELNSHIMNIVEMEVKRWIAEQDFKEIFMLEFEQAVSDKITAILHSFAEKKFELVNKDDSKN